MNRDIFLCGDPHGEFGHILAAIDQYHPKAVLILGDLTPTCSLDEIFKNVKGTQIYWIPGNHDTDTDFIYDRLWRSKYANHNLHGIVQEICGIRVAGLGGVFRGQIWMPPQEPIYQSPSLFLRKLGKKVTWRGGLPRRHRSTIFYSVYERLATNKANILITHEAPSMHGKGFAAIDKLAIRLGAKYIFHAHQHESKIYAPGSFFTARGLGLRGIIDLDGNIIEPAHVDPRLLGGDDQNVSHQKERYTRRSTNKFRRFSRKRKGPWPPTSRSRLQKRDSRRPPRQDQQSPDPQKER